MPSSKHGFTLIELLVGIVIMSVILGLGAASYRTFQKSQQLNQATQDLITNLRYAQSLALSGNKPQSCITANAPFFGYGVNIAPGGASYSIIPYCTGVELPASKTVTFPTGITANQVCVQFYSLNQGAGGCNAVNPGATTITLTNSQNAQQKSVTINQVGEINEQ